MKRVFQYYTKCQQIYLYIGITFTYLNSKRSHDNWNMLNVAQNGYISNHTINQSTTKRLTEVGRKWWESWKMCYSVIALLYCTSTVLYSPVLYCKIVCSCMCDTHLTIAYSHSGYAGLFTSTRAVSGQLRGSVLFLLPSKNQSNGFGRKNAAWVTEHTSTDSVKNTVIVW